MSKQFAVTVCEQTWRTYYVEAQDWEDAHDNVSSMGAADLANTPSSLDQASWEIMGVEEAEDD